MASVGATIGNEGPELSCGLKKNQGGGGGGREGEGDHLLLPTIVWGVKKAEEISSTTTAASFLHRTASQALEITARRHSRTLFHHENPLTYSFPIVHPGIFSLSTFFPLSVVAPLPEPRLLGSAVAPPPVSSLLPGGRREAVVSGLFLSVLYGVFYRLRLMLRRGKAGRWCRVTQ